MSVPISSLYIWLFYALCLLVLLLFVCVCIDGNLRFASYYGDHMVLQKSPEKAVVWGYGPEGAQVCVFLLGPVNQKASPVTVTKGEYRQLWSGGILMLTSAGY